MQGGANMARGRIGDLLHNQTWPPRISPGPSTDGATTGGITNDEGKALLITDSYSYDCFSDCQTRPLLDESFSSHSREYQYS